MAFFIYLQKFTIPASFHVSFSRAVHARRLTPTTNEIINSLFLSHVPTFFYTKNKKNTIYPKIQKPVEVLYCAVQCSARTEPRHSNSGSDRQGGGKIWLVLVKLLDGENGQFSRDGSDGFYVSAFVCVGGWMDGSVGVKKHR